MTWIAWRTSKHGFGLWHRQHDEGFTVCGKRPDGVISKRETQPKPSDECRTCYLNDREQPHGMR